MSFAKNMSFMIILIPNKDLKNRKPHYWDFCIHSAAAIQKHLESKPI